MGGEQRLFGIQQKEQRRECARWAQSNIPLDMIEPQMAGSKTQPCVYINPARIRIQPSPGRRRWCFRPRTSWCERRDQGVCRHIVDPKLNWLH